MNTAVYLASGRVLAKVFGAELQLEAVFGGVLGGSHHAGVVDQELDAWSVGAQLVGNCMDVVQ